MQWLGRIIDSSGTLGAIVAALGCAACFPVLGALAAALGLGFLAQFEGVFINTLLPIFAWIVLISNLVSFLFHRQWRRMLLAVSGPSMVLLTLYPLWSYGWSTYLFYAGLILMAVVAIWQIVSKPKMCPAHG